MPRSPAFWLRVAGAWLIVAGLAHAGMHVWSLVLENGFGGGLREFAVNAMKQAQSPDPLPSSLWRQHRAFSTSLGLLLFFTGVADLMLAAVRAPLRVVRPFTLFATVFWTIAFVPFAFLDPVAVPLAATVVAVPLHAIAHLSASLGEESETAG